ncbi:MAG: aspartyl-tRNA(Asn)/glutamyl-tRNA(Gln) amidotransferase subunit C [Hyphomicrobiaceae bacterium]|jgi:aspartyl-tRNA(Asn)/glutamyl-tRNA(Gln) amidotransferase subunit C
MPWLASNAAILQAHSTRGNTRAMDLTDADVRKVASLARLGLSETEIADLRNDMNGILDYVAKLSELDTEGIEPTSHVVTIKRALRKDVVTNEPCPEDAVANAPRREKTFFAVPTIIE